MWEHAPWAAGILLGLAVRHLARRRPPPGGPRAGGRFVEVHLRAGSWPGDRRACRCGGVKPLDPGARGADEEE